MPATTPATLIADLFPRQQRLSGKAACRSASCATSPAPPRSMTACCRWCIPTASSSEADLAKLPLVEPVYPLTEGLGLNQVRKAAEAALTQAARPAGMAGRGVARARRLSGLRRRAAHAAPPGRADRRRCRKARPGRGSPMTNCSPASSRWRWCARISAGSPAAARSGDGHAARQGDRGPALFADAVAGPRRRRHHHRSRPSRSACCGCCKATSAPARPWWRCSPPRP